MSLFNIDELEEIARSYIRLDDQSRSESYQIDEAMQTYSRFDYSKEYDIFLSHSYKDRIAVAGLVKHLKEQYGYEIYVDWIDDQRLNRSSVSKLTAKVIKNQMDQCRSLFYVTSENSSSSKWMPWELGLMDGKKGKVAICPLTRNRYATEYQGQEYLGLYPYVTEVASMLWINDDSKHYNRFERWLDEK